MKIKPLVLILCGGRSLRLWPISEYKSKNFLDIFGISPLEITIKRFLKITPKENIFLVANKKEKRFLQKIRLIKKQNIFFEPESRNTAAAVLLSLQHLKKYSQKPLIIAPIDHLIQREEEFYKSIYKSLEVAANGWICTFGIKPLEPTSDFGYIQVEKKMVRGSYTVKRFIEKPSISKAAKLIRNGNCFYNSGIFCACVGTLLGEYENNYPYYSDFCRNFKGKTKALYKKIKDIPFDKAIMEKSSRVKLIKGNFSWKDFGAWLSIYEVLPKDKSGNAIKGKAFVHKSKNSFIYLDDSTKKVLAMGLEDIFFIDTKNYTFLAGRSALSDLKATLKEFKNSK